jgi:CCR4-NOT transcriptional regulation complex NOT5 subunit
MIVLDKTNHKIQEMTDTLEMIEVQDTLEMIEVHVLHLDENLVEIVQELVNHGMINF